MSISSAVSRRSGGVFDVPRRRARLEEIEQLEAKDGFWNDARHAKATAREKTQIEQKLGDFEELEGRIGGLSLYWDLLAEGGGDDDAREAKSEVDQIESRLRAFEVREMLSGENDNAAAIVAINAGAGGTEAQDWASILLRMYLRYCDQKGFKVQLVDQLQGDEAGIKSATFIAEGPYAFGLLSAENGVHRLVRISPFDSAARRHTSFSSVFVYPDIEEEIDIQIQEKDLRVDTYRSGGAGGQKVNKTDSAVRLTHLPTGIVVACQNERSQHQNRAMAMKILKARLYEREVELKNKEKQLVEDSKMDIAWGSQIRSYVLAPYRMAKDHRTDYEVGDVMAVLDGRLEGFIEAYLMQKKPGGK